MPDLIADLRQKLADAVGDPTEPIDPFDHTAQSNRLIVAAVNALPGLLDELEAARKVIDHYLQPSPWGDWTQDQAIQWHAELADLRAFYGVARAANG